MDKIECIKIAELENKGEFLTVINQLYEKWKENKGNGEVFVRLTFECWYVLSEGYRIGLSEPTCNKAKSILVEIGNAIEENDIKEDYVLSHLGYMMTLFPDFFFENDDEEQYIKYQKIGSKMLNRAIQVSPGNKIAELFMLGNGNKEKEYNKLKKQLKPQILQKYNGEDCFDEYFRDVLTQE